MSSVQGLVFVLSGPSGVGKTSVTRLLREEGFPISLCVTATTRPPRDGEIPGQSYHFLSTEDFERLRERGELLECALVHGRWYGTPAWEVRDGLRRGADALLTVDPQGARTLRDVLKDPILIFLSPPDLDELVPRLQLRASESPEEVKRRLETARREMQEVSRFDYQIVNHRDRLAESAQALKAIITAERLKVHPRWVTLAEPESA
jgi:guanylate kinase